MGRTLQQIGIKKSIRGRKKKIIKNDIPKRKRGRPRKNIDLTLPIDSDLNDYYDDEYSLSDTDISSSVTSDPLPLSSDLIKEIKEEYMKVKKIYDRKVATDGYNYFDPEFTLKTTKIQVNISSGPSKYIHNKYTKNACFKNSKDESYYLPKGSLTYHIPIPTMRYWSHTNINIVGKDECALSHVPYLGDGEDDPSFTEELLNTYEEGIHGEKIGWNKIINDYILYHMATPIVEKYNLLENNQIYYLMKYIYDLFPNKNSAKEMAQNYTDLISRFTSTKNNTKMKLFNELGELKQHFSPSILQSSNRNLLCKRCYLIDCIIHPADVTCNDIHIQRGEKASDEIKEPCTIYCYKNFLPKTPSKRSPKKRTNATLELQLIEENLYWTPHEESVVNLLRKCHITSICRLTQLLSTLCRTSPKTCKQVYDYINRKGPFSPIIDTGERGEIEKDSIRMLVPLNHRVFRTVTGGQLNNHKPYVSCNHEGECSIENKCNCRKENRMCNKFCGCPTDCRHRFPGCRCKPGNCRTNQCQCFFASWECDPDMCHSCNCDGSDEINKPICKNINIQRCLQRKLYIAPSDVAGTGCFADEFIPKGEYIGEYVGEIISQMEAERRGKIYDKFKCSYLFTMNSDQAIDATRVGNIMRFINHSKHPNCAAKVMIVNGDHRIAFFALCDIQSHEELFFDYSYNSNQLKEFVYVEKNRNSKQREQQCLTNNNNNNDNNNHYNNDNNTHIL